MDSVTNVIVNASIFKGIFVFSGTALFYSWEFVFCRCTSYHFGTNFILFSILAVKFSLNDLNSQNGHYVMLLFCHNLLIVCHKCPNPSQSHFFTPNSFCFFSSYEKP